VLDTNILLDILLNRTQFIADSEAVILRCESEGIPMGVAWHGLATAFYLLKRGRTREEAELELDKIMAWATVASCGDREARYARGLGFSDFEDAMQAVCAASFQADFIVTRNKADFLSSPVPAITPEELLLRL
jgi:predicted nucleic acid-binding protein